MFLHSNNSCSYNVLNVNSLEYVPMNNQECKIKSEIINVNTNELLFYPYSIKIDVKAVVIQSMTHMLKYVFLTILKHKCQSI